MYCFGLQLMQHIPGVLGQPSLGTRGKIQSLPELNCSHCASDRRGARCAVCTGQHRGVVCHTQA